MRDHAFFENKEGAAFVRVCFAVFVTLLFWRGFDLLRQDRSIRE